MQRRISALLFASALMAPGASFSANLPAGWSADANASATLTMNDGALVIKAPNNVHAHIERSITQEAPFRVSAAIKSPDSGQLAPSIFLYWAPDTWLRIGYISSHDIYHVNGPGVYGVVCEGGKQTLYRLTTTSSADWTYSPEYGGLDKAPADSRWNRMALVLDKDSAHFQISNDGESWETVRSVDRDAAIASPPEKLIVGKGYYEAGKLTAPDLDNDLADPGAPVTVQIRDIKISPVSSEALKAVATPGEHFHDVYGEAELAKPGDPTFDSVASHWPPLQYPRDAIGVADHPEEFTVQPNGIIACWPNHLVHPKNHDGRRAWFLVGKDKTRFGEHTTVTRSLMDGWLPVLTCGFEHDGLQYEQTLAGWSQGMSPDKPLIGLLQFTVRNPGSNPAKTRVAFYYEHTHKEIATWDEITIPAGGEKSVWLEATFPAGSDHDITVIKTDEQTNDNKIAQVRDAWTKLISDHGMQISVPEKRVMNAWRAWQAWMFTDVDKIKGEYEYHDGGGGFYELVYGFSASQAAQMADTINRPEAARRWIEAMLSMGDGNGLYIINFGLPDQGALLSAVAHHYRYTHDKEWLKKVAPKIIKMCAWARDARAKAKSDTPTDSPAYGMIKLRPYCDHPDPGFYLISDVWLALGMEDTAAALADIGMTDDVKWIRAEADAYSADLRNVLKNSVFTVDGQKLLPLFPETRELLRAAGWMASDYYSLCVTSLLEHGGDILPSDSRYAKMIIDALENRGGLLMGVSRFWGGIDHAYAAGYWYHCLLHGQPEKAILGLYGSMAYGMSRDTFASVEVTFAKDGKNFPTMPHNYSNLQQIRLVRNLLVVEDGDQLILGAGIARPWLADGEHVEAKNAGTPWGAVSYRMNSRAADGVISVKIDPPKTEPADGIKIVFRHPDSAKIKSVEVKGAELANQGNDFVIIKNIKGEVTISAKY